MKIIKINDEFIKLDSFLKLQGLCQTGGETKNAILDGEVSVNGEIETRRGKKLRPGDTISFNGIEFKIGEK